MLADFADSIAEHAENEQREEYAAQDAELVRMRERIERLRGLCKSLVGMLRAAGGDEWIAEAEICQALIGDMEPPLDGNK